MTAVTNNLGGTPASYPKGEESSEAPLFSNFHGVRGRLPQELVNKLVEVCQKKGFRGQLDGDRHENWFDIYSKMDNQRTYVMVKDAVNGPVAVSGAASPDVMALLKEISAELGQK